MTVHIAASLGWFGAVAVFVALAVTGLTHPDAQMARAAYLSIHIATRVVIVPLAFGTLATGVVVALGTRWGLLQHYWIIAKLAITVVATAVLLVHTHPIEQVAHAAAGPDLGAADLRRMRIQLVVNAVAALVALLAATALAVYKPRGMTAYGRRKQHRSRSTNPDRPGRQRANTAAVMSTSGSKLRGSDPTSPMRRTRESGTPRWVKASTSVISVLLLHVTGRGLGMR